MNVGANTVEAGYNGTPWTYRRTVEDRFYIRAYTRRDVMSVREEAIRAARDIADHFHGERITVLYSGGRDSDMVLEAFRLAKADVVAVMVRGTSGFNDIELRHASEFEVRTGFDKFEVLELDHKSYIASQEYRSLLADVQCPYASFLWYWGAVLERKANDILVTGVMEPAIALAKGVWLVAMPEYEYSIYKLYDRCALKGVPSFFCWSGELWSSFLCSPVYMACLQNKTNSTHSNAVKGELLETQFGHMNRQKRVLHTMSEFWVDLSIWGCDVYTKNARQWLQTMGYWPSTQ